MPLINIRLAKDNLTDRTKQQLINAFTQAVADTLGKPSKSTWVIIDEVDAENWGVGGKTIAEMRNA